MDTKTCTGCGLDLPADDEHWYRRKTGATVQPCRECQRERARQRVQARTPEQLERRAAAQRERRAAALQADPDGTLASERERGRRSRDKQRGEPPRPYIRWPKPPAE